MTESIINVAEIWNTYDNDPNKYEATYDGEYISATGVVNYIGYDSHSTPSMELAETEDGTSYVLGVFGSFDEMNAVSIGDTITISGYFHIMSSENMVVLKRCQIIQIYPETNLTGDISQDGQNDTGDLLSAQVGEALSEKSLYTDSNGDSAVIPAEFMVSANEDEQTISQGLVVIAPDSSEYAWIPTTVTPLTMREFGSYYSGSGSVSDYHDETELAEYQQMAASVEKYGGFYIGRYEASKGEDGLPASKRITEVIPKKYGCSFLRRIPHWGNTAQLPPDGFAHNLLA